MKKLNKKQIYLLTEIILLATISVLCLLGAGCVIEIDKDFAMMLIFGFIFLLKATGWVIEDYKASFKKGESQ